MQSGRRGSTAAKPTNLSGYFAHGAGRHLVIAVDAGGIAVAQREDDGLVDPRHGGMDGIGIGDGADRARPGISGPGGEERPQMLRFPEIDMAVDDHGGGPHHDR